MEHLRTRIQTIGADDAERRVDIVRPVQSLAPFITHCNAYSERNLVRTRRRELPDGLATIVFNLSDPLHIEHPAATRTTFDSGAGFFSGASTTYAVSDMAGAQQGVQVMLTPLGARRLLGIPLAEVGDRLIDPADLLGPAIRETVARLQAATEHHDRLAILEHAMLGRILTPSSEPPADLVWALARLRATHGRVRVDALAASIGCSRKHLTVRFTREFAMPPKAMARVLRFGHAIRRLRRDQVTSWADLAAECGYADQSHLGRDVAALSGDWPRALAARSLPDDAGFLD